MHTYPIFDQAIVKMNSQGHLTPAQEDMLNTYRGCYRLGLLLALIAITGSFAFLIGVVVFSDDFNEPHMQDALPFIVGPFGVIFILIFLWTGYSVYRARDLRSERISEVTDTAKVWSKEIRPRGGGRYTAYFMKVGKIRFQFPDATTLAEFQDGQQYRVFYIRNPPNHILLSAERH